MASVIDHPDYFLLDADLTDVDRALRDRVRAFGQNTIEPIINGFWYRHSRFESWYPSSS
ncbi:hypothetical protein [Arthrobacter sp. AQ5-05]|uniref:hypothetical protein n=1 Tax=Arthrobacter sp. AQ5-05 TaxID=2184581 RepID=UPI0015ECCBE3|nr:hypothetical protein [Arthrobacter sp. AQ5-05]